MLKSALVPFALTCLLYTLIGWKITATGEVIDMRSLFSGTFVLHWITVVPALVVLLLSVLRVNVKWSMGASILSAMIIALTTQKLSIMEIFSFSIWGVHAAGSESRFDDEWWRNCLNVESCLHCLYLLCLF